MWQITILVLLPRQLLKVAAWFRSMVLIQRTRFKPLRLGIPIHILSLLAAILGNFLPPQFPSPTWSRRNSGLLTPRISTTVSNIKSPKTRWSKAVYVGSLSRKAIASTNLKGPQLTGSNPNNLMAQYQAAVASGSNPVSSISPDCARPLANCDANFVPQGATQIITNVSNGSSSSNELQVTIDRRMNHGLGFRVAYTLAKTIDVSQVSAPVLPFTPIQQIPPSTAASRTLTPHIVCA